MNVLICWLTETAYVADNGMAYRRHPGDEEIMPEARAKSFVATGMARIVPADETARRVIDDGTHIPDSG